jgi:hypothetical protein
VYSSLLASKVPGALFIASFLRGKQCYTLVIVETLSLCNSFRDEWIRTTALLLPKRPGHHVTGCQRRSPVSVFSLQDEELSSPDSLIGYQTISPEVNPLGPFSATNTHRCSTVVSGRLGSVTIPLASDTTRQWMIPAANDYAALKLTHPTL